MPATATTIERITGKLSDQPLLFQYTIKLVLLVAFLELILYRLVSRLGMGQLDHYINIWHWKADWQTDIDRRAARSTDKQREGVRTFEVIPRRVSSVEDLIGGGFSTLTTKEKQGRVQGKATWKDGVWHVVMRRPLGAEEQDNEAKLIPGRVQTVAFAVWNGENKERNGQKAVAPWPWNWARRCISIRQRARSTTTRRR